MSRPSVKEMGRSLEVAKPQAPGPDQQTDRTLPKPMGAVARLAAAADQISSVQAPGTPDSRARAGGAAEGLSGTPGKLAADRLGRAQYATFDASQVRKGSVLGASTNEKAGEEQKQAERPKLFINTALTPTSGSSTPARDWMPSNNRTSASSGFAAAMAAAQNAQTPSSGPPKSNFPTGGSHVRALSQSLNIAMVLPGQMPPGGLLSSRRSAVGGTSTVETPESQKEESVQDEAASQQSHSNLTPTFRRPKPSARRGARKSYCSMEDEARPEWLQKYNEALATSDNVSIGESASIFWTPPVTPTFQTHRDSSSVHDEFVDAAAIDLSSPSATIKEEESAEKKEQQTDLGESQRKTKIEPVQNSIGDSNDKDNDNIDDFEDPVQTTDLEPRNETQRAKEDEIEIKAEPKAESKVEPKGKVDPKPKDDPKDESIVESIKKESEEDDNPKNVEAADAPTTKPAKAPAEPPLENPQQDAKTELAPQSSDPPLQKSKLKPEEEPKMKSNAQRLKGRKEKKKKRSEIDSKRCVEETKERESGVDELKTADKSVVVADNSAPVEKKSSETLAPPTPQNSLQLNEVPQTESQPSVNNLPLVAEQKSQTEAEEKKPSQVVKSEPKSTDSTVQSEPLVNEPPLVERRPSASDLAKTFGQKAEQETNEKRAGEVNKPQQKATSEQPTIERRSSASDLAKMFEKKANQETKQVVPPKSAVKETETTEAKAEEVQAEDKPVMRRLSTIEMAQSFQEKADKEGEAMRVSQVIKADKDQ